MGRKGSMLLTKPALAAASCFVGFEFERLPHLSASSSSIVVPVSATDRSTSTSWPLPERGVTDLCLSSRVQYTCSVCPFCAAPARKKIPDCFFADRKWCSLQLPQCLLLQLPR